MANIEYLTSPRVRGKEGGRGMTHKEAIDRAISDFQAKRQEALRKWRDEQCKAELYQDVIGQLEILRDHADKDTRPRHETE